MIRGIYYFSTGLKTKIDVSPRNCFKWCTLWKFNCSKMTSVFEYLVYQICMRDIKIVQDQGP